MTPKKWFDSQGSDIIKGELVRSGFSHASQNQMVVRITERAKDSEGYDNLNDDYFDGAQYALNELVRRLNQKRKEVPTEIAALLKSIEKRGTKPQAPKVSQRSEKLRKALVA